MAANYRSWLAVEPALHLFIISVNPFSTIDTLTNAATARHSLERELGDRTACECHFLGVSFCCGEDETEVGLYPRIQPECALDG